MRANRKCREVQDRAEVGIGTMIVFIATVLVAAIAAGVLIDTSGKLQERSSRTGQEATEEVSSTLSVISVMGRRDTTNDAGLRDLDAFITAGSGSFAIDLSAVSIQLQNGTQLRTFNYSRAATPGAGQFNATEVRDSDGSFSNALPVMSTGDIINITIPLDTNGIMFEHRDQVAFIFLPEVGSMIDAGFRTPASYGARLQVELR